MSKKFLVGHKQPQSLSPICYSMDHRVFGTLDVFSSRFCMSQTLGINTGPKKETSLSPSRIEASFETLKQYLGLLS